MIRFFYFSWNFNVYFHIVGAFCLNHSLGAFRFNLTFFKHPNSKEFSSKTKVLIAKRYKTKWWQIECCFHRMYIQACSFHEWRVNIQRHAHEKSYAKSTYFSSIAGNFWLCAHLPRVNTSAGVRSDRRPIKIAPQMCQLLYARMEVYVGWLTLIGDGENGREWNGIFWPVEWKAEFCRWQQSIRSKMHCRSR